jgi:hypothetical protein
MPEGHARIDWLAIPTCGRPALLKRALRSYVANAKKYDRNYSFLIADDSRDASDRALNRRITSEIARRSGGRFFYSSRLDRSRFARALASDGKIPERVTRFALLGEIGANRNGVLLQTLSGMVLSADDDTVCHPGTVGGSNPEATETWYFKDRKRALAFVRPAEIDFAAEHERLLGTGGVILTTNGVAGDCGMGNHRNSVIMMGEPATRARLRTNKAYGAALSSRETVRQSVEARVTHCGPFMATCFGLDNRQSLPPFFPVHRNEDGLFGHMLLRLLPSALAGHLPFVVEHAPPGRRPIAPADVARVRISEVLIAALSLWGSGELGGELGQHLIVLGELPVSEFVACLQVPLRQRAEAMANRCDGILVRYPHRSGDQWAIDLKHAVEELRRSAESIGFVLPADVTAQTAKKLVRQFGELLCWWPAIVERATELRAKGITVARPETAAV